MVPDEPAPALPTSAREADRAILGDRPRRLVVADEKTVLVGRNRENLEVGKPGQPSGDDLLFRQVYAFFIVHLASRRVVFGAEFDGVAEGAGARVIKTAVRAPNMNAIAERFVGIVRGEALDHVLLLGAKHLDALVREYRRYFNEGRPHQALGQRRPFGGPDRPNVTKPITRRLVPGGLHVDYRRAA